MLPATVARLARAFLAFINRPYFSRVWVLQELYMGKRPLLCCGQDFVSAKVMLTLHYLFDFDLQAPEKVWPRCDWASTWPVGPDDDLW